MEIFLRSLIDGQIKKEQDTTLTLVVIKYKMAEAGNGKSD
jgi:hypothetical protein